MPVSHYFRLPESEKGVYEIGSEAKIWVVADPPTPQLGDTVNLTGTVADNFSLGDYYLGLVILEKSRRLVYDYPGPTSPPVPTHPPSPPQIERVPPEINLFTAPGTNPPAEEMRIGLRNDAAPYWLARVDKPWLKVIPTEGSLSAGNDRMTVEADVSQFPVGLYPAIITLRMETVEREMAVRVYVTNGLPGQKLAATVEVGRGTAWTPASGSPARSGCRLGSWNDRCLRAPTSTTRAIWRSFSRVCWPTTAIVSGRLTSGRRLSIAPVTRWLGASTWEERRSWAIFSGTSCRTQLSSSRST